MANEETNWSFVLVKGGSFTHTLELFADEYRAHAERGECLAGACELDRTLHPLAGPLAGLGPESVR